MALYYGSVCSGIEAATVAWHPMGWVPAWFSEIEDFPSKILQQHYPYIPNLGDMTKLYENETFKKRKIDLLVGGTPCQSFSLAGERAGLDDPRGDLALEFLRIVKEKKPRWFVWENVPGVLSSSEGRDFGAFLRSVQKLGYGFTYRVLDSQYFGGPRGWPQRRRRLFVVGHFRDWRCAAEVLFDGQNVLGHPTSLKEGDEGKASVSKVAIGNSGSYKAGVGKSTTIKAGYYKCYNDLENRDNLIVSRLNHKTYIRRLTPLECERLQGFPDDYTKLNGCSDGARYKAIGNSMAVPVMRWIGQRINKVDKR